MGPVTRPDLVARRPLSSPRLSVRCEGQQARTGVLGAGDRVSPGVARSSRSQSPADPGDSWRGGAEGGYEREGSGTWGPVSVSNPVGPRAAGAPRPLSASRLWVVDTHVTREAPGVDVLVPLLSFSPRV